MIARSRSASHQHVPHSLGAGNVLNLGVRAEAAEHAGEPPAPAAGQAAQGRRRSRRACGRRRGRRTAGRAQPTRPHAKKHPEAEGRGVQMRDHAAAGKPGDERDECEHHDLVVVVEEPNSCRLAWNIMMPCRPRTPTRRTTATAFWPSCIVGSACTARSWWSPSAVTSTSVPASAANPVISTQFPARNMAGADAADAGRAQRAGADAEERGDDRKAFEDVAGVSDGDARVEAFVDGDAGAGDRHDQDRVAEPLGHLDDPGDPLTSVLMSAELDCERLHVRARPASRALAEAVRCTRAPRRAKSNPPAARPTCRDRTRSGAGPPVTRAGLGAAPPSNPAAPHRRRRGARARGSSSRGSAPGRA